MWKDGPSTFAPVTAATVFAVVELVSVVTQSSGLFGEGNEMRMMVTCRMSHVACHTSHITHHTSHITHHTSHVTPPSGKSKLKEPIVVPCGWSVLPVTDKEGYITSGK